MEDPPEQPQDAHRETASPPPDAIHCVSGLIYKVLRPGGGEERPGPDDVVQVLYRPRTEAARLSAATGDDESPQTLVVSHLIPGLAEAVQLMTVGVKMRVWIPPSLSSGEAGGAEGTLTYDIELLAFTRVKEPRAIPIELTSPRLPE
ncbi:MAG TPA: FKBP-type peptidyl-prolyl cis-trans isomerase [Pyrinomonadaceae bacterium]|nr:FKBP-type peptidyl-prolyl cis-trans isomerase [Pyrinomonadaceae bacterium]